MKPLNVSPFCKNAFEKCTKTLTMSAIILDMNAFCLGLAPKEIKFIQVTSDFPLQNRPIYPLNVAYLNSDSLNLQEVQIKIARAIDNLITLRRRNNSYHILLRTRFYQTKYFRRKQTQTFADRPRYTERRSYSRTC